jgi:hypothetical protein
LKNEPSFFAFGKMVRGGFEPHNLRSMARARDNENVKKQKSTLDKFYTY